jgi:hypothetical protein
MNGIMDNLKYKQYADTTITLLYYKDIGGMK